MWDHPRVCGKNLKRLFARISAMGSPPRVREKLFAKGCRGLILRITPASAGKTLTIEFLPPSQQDHPRECGKNDGMQEKRLTAEGSPPRVREKQVRKRIGIGFIRITPASAGKT